MTEPQQQTNVNFAIRKLGKKRARNDPRNLKFSKYWSGTKPKNRRLPPVPQTNNDMGSLPYAADGNLRYGDCVFAAMAHLIETWRSISGHPITFTEALVLQAYSEVTGFNPNDPNTDQGTDMTVALKWWRDTGMLGPDGVRHKIAAWVQIDTKNAFEMEAGELLFDGIFLGAGLPITAQTQLIWDVPAGGPTGNGAPYSWGGHCVPYLAYDQQKCGFPSWGSRLGATWAFSATYADEAFVVITQDQLNDLGLSSDGFNIQQLQQDLIDITSAQPPTPTFTPDPNTVAWLDWEKQIGDYVPAAYAAGEVDSAIEWQDSLYSHMAGIAHLLNGQPQRLPKHVPQLPPRVI